MDAIEGEDLARQIHELRALVVNLQNMVEGLVKHGPVTDIDAKTQRVRIQIGTEPDEKNKEKKKPMKSAWVPYGLGFAGEFSQIWHPSVGQNMTLVSPHGDKAQSVAYPFTYSKKYPTPSDNPNCHILCNFGSSRIEVWKEQIVIISDNIHLTALKGDITETADRHIEMEAKDLKKNTKVVRNKPDDDKEQKTPDKSGSLISQITGAPDPDKGTSEISLNTGSPDKTESKITLQTGSPKEADSSIALKTGSPDNANSKITLQTGSPKEGDSLIGITTGDPGTGTSAIAIQTGKPTVGDTLIAVIVNPPILGSCQYDLISGGSITQMAATTTTNITGLDYTITAGLNYNVMAGLDVTMTAGNNYTITAALNLEAMIGLKVEVFAGAPVEVHAPEIALLGHTDVGGYGGPPIARVGDKVAVDVITGLGNIITGAGNSNAV